MSGAHNQFQLRLTIARFLEVSYHEDSGLTTKLVKSAGPLKLKVDQDGNASLSGSAGVVNFSASDAIKDIGVSFKGVSVALGADHKGNLTYRASYDFVGASASFLVTGSLNIEKLIMSCSGLLCRAARPLGNRQDIIDMELRKAMGQ